MERSCACSTYRTIKILGVILLFLIMAQLMFNISFDHHGGHVLVRGSGMLLKLANGNFSILLHVDPLIQKLVSLNESIVNDTIRIKNSRLISANSSNNYSSYITHKATHNQITDCPENPTKLVGNLATYTSAPSYEQMEKGYRWLQAGGTYKTTECRTKHRVAVIVPYRNRESQLKIFLYNIHPFLRRQQLDYGIYIVEQSGKTMFNRAMLMNIGYAEAIKIYNYNCFVFHDVDLIPENDHNLYSCGEQPRHLSAAIDKFKYILPYKALFGGVSQIPRKAFERTNGYSNKFFGWGGEDDDMYNRITSNGYKIQRYSMKIAKYKMIKHSHESSNKDNPERFRLIREGHKRYKTDGINSLRYKLLEIDKRKLFTLVKVDINEAEVMKT